MAAPMNDLLEQHLEAVGLTKEQVGHPSSLNQMLQLGVKVLSAHKQMNISSLPDLDISGADLIAEYGTSLFSNVKKNAIKNEEKLEIKSEPIGKMEEIKSEPIGKMEENESENVEKDSEIENFYSTRATRKGESGLL